MTALAVATGVEQQFLYDGEHGRLQLPPQLSDRQIAIELDFKTATCSTIGNQAAKGSRDIGRIRLRSPLSLLTNAMLATAFNKVFVTFPHL
jgi:hypothetical protein